MKIILSKDADELYYEEKNIVSFEIQSTPELDTIVDGIRKRKGYIPFFDETGSSINYNGWYEFYLEFNISNNKLVGIVAVVNGNADKETCPDDKDIYRLEEFTSFDQDDVAKQLIDELNERNTSLLEIKEEIAKIKELEEACQNGNLK